MNDEDDTIRHFDENCSGLGHSGAVTSVSPQPVVGVAPDTGDRQRGCSLGREAARLLTALEGKNCISQLAAHNPIGFYRHDTRCVVQE